jgi:hypothetical protein
MTCIYNRAYKVIQFYKICFYFLADFLRGTNIPVAGRRRSQGWSWEVGDVRESKTRVPPSVMEMSLEANEIRVFNSFTNYSTAGFLLVRGVEKHPLRCTWTETRRSPPSPCLTYILTLRHDPLQRGGGRLSQRVPNGSWWDSPYGWAGVVVAIRRER